MRLSVAWPRLLSSSLLFFLPLASAHEDTLFTSSVSYCAPPENLLVQQFDVAYIAHNHSVSFNISAASVQANVNVTANLFLNVYGMHPANITIDICSLFSGALCPLPVYNFVGAESIALPDSVNLDIIPGIAYKIPDLEAFAQLTLLEVGTGDLKACIQTTISNGWSTQQTAVSWATGGIAFLALFSSAWQSLIPEALAPFRLLDLIALYQYIASSGFLNLNYPVVYRAFTLDFSWAMGLFGQSSTSSMQNSITNMRSHTGGSMVNATDDGVALVNRKLSPYNVLSVSYAAPKALSAAVKALPTINLADISDSTYVAPTNVHNFTQLSAVNEVQTVTKASSNVLEAGVPIYVNGLGIATANAFMSVFLVTLIFIAITLAVLAIFYGILLLFSRSGSSSKSTWVRDIQNRFPVLARAWALRLVLICFFPLVVFAFYQWTLKDSWLSILISVITFIAIMGSVGYATARVLLHGRRSSPFMLLADLPSYEPLYGQFRAPRFFFFALPILATFLRSLFIAFSKENGTVQVALIVVIEAFLLLSLSVLRPGKTRRADVLSIFLAIVRLVCAGLSIAFLENLGLGPIPRVAIGIVMAVILSVTVVIMFFNTLWNLGLQSLWHRRPSSSRHRSQTSSSSDTTLARSDPEKRGKHSSEEHEDPSPSYPSSTFTTSRPTNPTPTHNLPLDPSVNRPYPAFTPTTTYAEPPSAQSTDTEMSYGTQIPTRLMHTRSSSNSYSLNDSPSQYTPTPLSTSIGIPSNAGHGDSPDTPSRLSHSRHPTIEEEQGPRPY